MTSVPYFWKPIRSVLSWACTVGDHSPAATTAAIRTRLMKLIIVLLKNMAPSFGCGGMDRRGHGVDWLMVRGQKMAPCHVPVSAIDQIVVVGDEPVSLPLIGLWDLVPRQAGPVVM